MSGVEIRALFAAFVSRQTANRAAYEASLAHLDDIIAGRVHEYTAAQFVADRKAGVA